MIKLSNITIQQFTDFLKAQGLKEIRTSGGHSVWSRSNLSRPIILQTHIEPIPEFIIKSNLQTLGVSKKEFLDFFEHPKK